MRNLLAYLCLALLCCLCLSCSDSKQYAAALCALVDVSGTYADEKANVVKLIKAGVLPELMPGDSLFLISIDSNSYHEDNLIDALSLDYRPSQANTQKLAFAEKLDDFAASGASAKYTDISGAMMLCSDYLKNTQNGIQAMLIFSDMREELPSGVKREYRDDEFKNMHLAALNVIKLNNDSNDPEVFRQRLNSWKEKTLAADANDWTTIIDATKLPAFIQTLRD